ncbi:MAG: phytanoyl-CoA dioxygenase family protein [Bacteroidota bacterium]
MDAAKELELFGYTKINNIVSEETCAILADRFDEIEKKRRDAGNLYTPGGQTVIYNAHLEDPDLFLPMIDIPEVLAVVEKVLGPNFILDTCAGSRSSVAEGKFGPHIDGHLPISDFAQTTDVQMLICLDPFTETNGSTKVWPLSHKTGIRIHGTDWYKEQMPQPVVLSAPRGTLVMFLGQTWHQIGLNVDNTRRWGLILQYRRWWMKPSFDYTKCGEAIFNKLNDTQKKLLGFTSRPPASADTRIKTIMDINNLPKTYKEAIEC